MAAEAELASNTRLLFLGDDTLADGFRLIGFETFASPTPEDVEHIFGALLRERGHAFVVMDGHLMGCGAPSLRQARQEGGRIAVAFVPRLNEPPRLASDVADRLAAMFGQDQADSG